MDFYEVVKNRFSVRKFKKKKISEEIITRIIEISNLSPSSRNRQARAVVVLNNKTKIESVVEKAIGQEWIKDSPVVLIICANLNEAVEKTAFTDAVVMASYIQLALVNEGLSSCWVGGFYEEKLRHVLNLPETIKPVVILPIGYSDEYPQPKKRKKTEDIIFAK